MRDWASGHAKPIAWVSCLIVILLGLTYPVLLYLDRNAGLQLHGLPGISELVSLTTAFAGALIIARQPKNLIGWMLTFDGVAGLITSDAQLYSVFSNTVHHRSLVGGAFSAWLGSWLFVPGLALDITLVLLLFPDGRLPSAGWRPVGWLSAGALLVATAGVALGAIPRSSNFVVDAGGVLATSSRTMDTQALSILPFLCGLICLAGLVVRFRRSQGQERQQLEWFTYGGVVLAAGLVISVISVLGPDTKGSPAWVNAFQQLTTLAFPVAIGISVLKYRLYDIDVVINRTLVFGSLAAFITAVYVGIVVGIGALVGSGSQPNLVLSIVATAIVAVAFQPVRERMQKIANRLVYGNRATPYEVLAEFSERVAESYAAGEVLARMARVLGEGTGAQSAQVWLRGGQQLRRAAMWPSEPRDQDGENDAVHVGLTGQLLPEMLGADRAVPVRHQGELLGALTIRKRQGESLTPIEQKLLEDLANQAGLVLKNVGLTADLEARLEDLRRSRQRLVAAQDQERRRLERNLHDGAQQNLVALKVKLGLAEMTLARDPGKAKQLITELKADTDQTLETLRDLARGIYPPLLADRGLGAALEAQARKATVPIQVEAVGVGRYSQEMEAAVYFCCLEALQNVQKYADATSVTVRLTQQDHMLRFEVFDDGRGFDAGTAKLGSGLTNMTDRLDALGGNLVVSSTLGHGTRITGALALTGLALASAAGFGSDESLLAREAGHLKVAGP